MGEALVVRLGRHQVTSPLQHICHSSEAKVHVPYPPTQRLPTKLIDEFVSYGRCLESCGCTSPYMGAPRD